MSDATRWAELADAEAVGDELTESELRLLAEIDDAEVERERQLYRSMQRAGEPGPVLAKDLARAEETLARFRREQAPPPSRRVAMGVGAAFVAAAAALVLWTGLPDRTTLHEAEGRAVVTSGTLMSDDLALSSGDELPVERWVVARERACVDVAKGQGCVSASARLRTRGDAIELDTGELTFEGSGRFETRHGNLVATEAAFELVLTPDGGWLQAERGQVTFESQTVEPGQRIAWGGEQALAQAEPNPAVEPEPVPVAPEPAVADVVVEPPAAEVEPEPEPAVSPRPPTTTPGELLSAARRHVAAGNSGRALATYATLRRQHPRSAEAHTANVSVGELELRRGRSKAALRAFARYLDGGGGALAEEAHWGKVQALHRLGRIEQRDAAIGALRKAHPGSVYLGRASKL
ncbi:MAG: tetratricopeptide repeat protein [Myxococcota bacterium]